MLPGDLAPRGRQHAGLVRGLVGWPPADRTVPELLLGPVLGLLLNVGLDQLPSDLVAQGAGERLELREGSALGQAVGVDLPSELPSDLGQLRL